jgi:precorrin-6A/cobalt-precorrin-6A reductase
MTPPNPTGKIWLIGGTQESAELARAIAQTQIPCLISVTTEAARSLYPVVSNLHIQVGKLATDQIQSFLQTEQITAILDASHPFAVEISQLAIAISTELAIPYLRFERPTSESATLDERDSILHLDSFATLLSGDYLIGERVLLTIGYRPLALFQPVQSESTLFARILPSPIALETALAAGFTTDRLIALRPPIDLALEKALWQQWQISLVVTKASGSPGGEDIKRQAALELGTKLIVIDRPSITYPQQTSSLPTALKFCHELG